MNDRPSSTRITEAQPRRFEPSRADYDPLSSQSTNDPFTNWACLRRESPVFFSPAQNMWIVSRYEDVETVLRDTKRYHVLASIFMESEVPEELAKVAPEGLLDAPLADDDPKGHMRWRKLTIQVFTPAKAEKRAPELREVVDRLIDGFVSEGRADLVARLAVPLPIIAIARILGLPEGDAERLECWSDNSMRLGTAQIRGQGSPLDLWRTEIDYYRYVETVVEDRRSHPRENDLLTDLINARDADTPSLTTRELVALIRAFVVAGNETTRMLIGTLILRLLEDPEQMAAVRADPSLVKAAVEEALRHSGPAKGLMRVTTEDVQLSGVNIPKGQVVQTLFASANRDAAEFERPEVFDVRRSDSHKHLAFGKGLHFCVGAFLARVEARVALEQVLKRLPGLRRATAESPQWHPSVVAFGLVRLDVEWDTKTTP
ncbi:MAG: cytochrome P450, partial [Steroidobacteraceae bacterium]